jgi:acyl-CoA reductase-like NAD-dependent aldehyde dehydrogenase
LAARIFTSNPSLYQQHVTRLKVGLVAFNRADYLTHNLPVEGWKRSGKGKYLSALSYEEFVKYKSYVVDK